MKRTAILMAICMTVGAYANDSVAQTNSDSQKVTVVVTDVTKDPDVTIINPDGDSEFSESDFNIDFPFVSRRSRGKGNSGISFEVKGTMMLGFVSIVGGDNDAKFQMGRSIEFYMPNLLQFKINTGVGTPSIRLGAGFGLQHIFGKNGACFDMSEEAGEQRLATVPFPEGAVRASSKINRFAITVPLMIDQKIGESGKISAGAILDFNTHLGATSKYNIDNTKTVSYYGNLAMRPITYELMGAVSSSSFGIYFKWAPMNVFKKHCGPNMKNLSVGIVICL